VFTWTPCANAGNGIYDKAQIQPSIELQASPFDLDQVRLLDGPFKDAMELDRKYLLELDPDRMLGVIFKCSGQTPKVDHRYGGGCSGTLVGHYLTAISKMHASTGDEELKKRAHYMVDELERVQVANGGQYIGVRNSREMIQKKLFDAEVLNAIHGNVNGLDQFLYCWHKTTAGLIDAFVHTGSEKAVGIAARYADWFVERFTGMDDAKFQTMLKMENGGIMEAMAWLYALTGKTKYLELAKRFDHKRDMDALARREDRFKGLHANTTIPKVIGAAVVHEWSGLERYSTIAEFFWQRVVKTRSFLTGGVDYQEYFMGPGDEAAFLDWDANETCCVYNMQKLTRHLFSWEPRAEYMDYYERILYNHILATQDPDGIGRFSYFSGLKPGDFKVYSTPFDSMWCCVKTGMENHAKHGNTIYFHGDDTLWINLFIPSVLDWKEKGLSVRQETRFPESDRMTLKLETEQPQALSLKLRVPYWAAGEVEVTINGKKQDISTRPQSYLTLTRTWKNGDVIDYRIPMNVHLYTARDDQSAVGLVYGPIVLAGLWGDDFMPDDDSCGWAPHFCFLDEPLQPVPVLLAGAGDPSSWVKRIDGHPLLFRTLNTHNRKEVILGPVYRAHHQRYSSFWKLVDPTELDAPPQPEQALWLVPPYAASGSSIAMVAAEADHPVAGPVEYYFAEQIGHPGGDDSGWQTDPVYIDTGLQPDTEYAYRLLTRSGANIRWDNYVMHYRVVESFQIPLADPLHREGIPSDVRRAACPREDPLVFRQHTGDEGLITLETENFLHKEDLPDAAWQVVHQPSGLSGGLGMQALPDRGRTVEEELDTASPRLDYEIRFSRAGRHYLWIRGYGIEQGHSVYVGLDDEAPAADQTVSMLWFRYSWDNVRVAGATPIDVPEKGIYTLNIWMRQDGCVVDKILITSDPELKL
jgi:DUF1680 family protein